MLGPCTVPGMLSSDDVEKVVDLVREGATSDAHYKLKMLFMNNIIIVK